MKSLSDLYRMLEKNSRRPFLVLERDVVSYGQLHSRVGHFVGMFNEYQVKPGQRIVVCSDDENFVASVVAAAFFHGIASVILSAETTSVRALAIIKQSEPALVLLDEQLQSVWQLEAEQATFSVAKMRSAGSSVLQRFKRKSARQGWLEKIEEYEPHSPALPADLSLNCFISFTSGTTGSAKGVQLTYRNLLTHLQTLTDVFSYSAGSRILNNMILAHADGLIQGPILALYNGCTLYRPCSMDVQHLETFLNTVYRERATHMLTVPTILSFMDRLAGHDDYFHSGDFCHLISVAGMLDTGLWQRLEQRFSVRICNIYGLTETVAGGVFLRSS